MPTFSYNARDATGDPRTGTVEASDRRDAVASVRDLGLSPIRVEEQGGDVTPTPRKSPAKSSASPRTKPKGKPKSKLSTPAKARSLIPGREPRLPVKVILQFSIDLRDLLSAGMTLGTSIQKLSRQSGNPQRALILQQVHEDIVQGKSLSEALAKHPRSFPDFYVSVIRAGEAGGQLQQALENAVRHYERAAEAREQITGSLVYPCIVAGFGVLVIVGCLIFVIPQFTQIFQDLDQALPWPTAFLMAVSRGLITWGPLMIALIIGFLAAFSQWKKTEAGRYAWHGFLLKVPVFNRIIRTGAYANFARTLSNLLTNGVPVLRALDIVRKTLGNAVLEREVGDLKNRVTDGSSLSRPLSESGVFPEVFTDMLAVGEEAGKVPRSLAQIARRYDEELTRNIKLFTTVIEPVLMVFIAAAVGFVALSMLLPIFQLTRGLR